MKKNILILSLLLFVVIGFAQKKSKFDFEMEVFIKNYPADSTLKLGRYYQGKTYFVDTFTFDKKNKSFVLRRDTVPDSGMYMLISYENVPHDVIIDHDHHFTVRTEYKNIEGKDAHYFDGSTFENSLDNQLFLNFNLNTASFRKEMDSLRMVYTDIQQKEKDLDTNSAAYAALKIRKQNITDGFDILNAKLETLKDNFLKDNPEHIMTVVFKAQKEIDVPDAPDSITDDIAKQRWRWEYYYNHYFDNIDLHDARLVRTPIYPQKLQNYIEKILPPHPDTIKFALERLIEKTRGCDEIFKYTVWYPIDYYQRSPVVGYDAIWVYLAKKYYLPKKEGDTLADAFWATPGMISNLKNRIEKVEPLLIGNVPPEFYCPDTNVDRPNQKMISCFAPAKNHRYTVVMFWEPSCSHCRKKIPELRDLYNAKKDELDFEVYAVGKDHNVGEWKEYIYKNNIDKWINVNGKTSNINFDDRWDIISTPTLYVLDNKHRIVTKRIEPEQIEPFIKMWNEEYYKLVK
ncbi:MAG: DUF5106 domain-containing protein [Bacteroidales bacterium]|jgi:thiol-disulfide isomerase/thioredoxin|nr:DUF5106 domain-containing protein [Bacteroidales bacterium]